MDLARHSESIQNFVMRQSIKSDKQDIVCLLRYFVIQQITSDLAELPKVYDEALYLTIGKSLDTKENNTTESQDMSYPFDILKGHQLDMILQKFSSSECISWNVYSLLEEVVQKGWDVAQKCMSPPSTGLRNLFDTILSFFQWLDDIRDSMPSRQCLSLEGEVVMVTPPSKITESQLIEESHDNVYSTLHGRKVLNSISTTATSITKDYK